MPKKVMRSVTAFCFGSAIIASILYCYLNRAVGLTLAITFGTTAYHFGIRLLTGYLYDVVMKNRVDYTKKWFHVRLWEKKLYRLLRVSYGKIKCLHTIARHFPEQTTHGKKLRRRCASQSWCMKRI